VTGNPEEVYDPAAGVPGVSPRWNVKITDCCPCPVLFTDGNGNAVDYLRPDAPIGPTSGDPAPWYRAEVPESAEFLGVMVTDLTGLDSVVSRSVTDRGAAPGGGFLGVQRQSVREISVEATLVATTCAGLDYGRRWLSHTLANDPCDDCGSYALEVRTTCPPGLEPPLSDVGLKTLYDVGLIEGPTRVADSVGRQGCDYLDVTWKMVAADPWLYECPVVVLPRTLGPTEPTTSGESAEWIAGFDPPTPFGIVGLIVTIETGSDPKDRDFVIEGWTLLPGEDCDTARESPPCYRLELADVPSDSTVVLDGARRRLTIREPGEEERDALPYVVLGSGDSYEWPESTGCLPTCVVVSHDGGDEAVMAVEIQTQQRFLA
jgi:hypothetical protein